MSSLKPWLLRRASQAYACVQRSERRFGAWVAHHRKLQRLGIAGAALLLLLLLLLPRLMPKPPLSDIAPFSRSVFASQGELLRLTLASDQQYRLWVPLEKMSPVMVQAAILYEDRQFYWHPGISPWALVRAATATAVGTRRIGGSTITMQLARRAYRIQSNHWGGKLRQIAAALWLELRYSKHDILEAYLNLAPYGGNIEGVGAASLILLHKPASELTLPEALTLAVIPQNPKKRIGEQMDAQASQSLQESRLRLARVWAGQYPQDAALVEPNALRISFYARAKVPFRAPHLVDALLQQSQDKQIVSTISLPMQSVVERVLAQYIQSRKEVGIKNASALMLDTATMEVKAMVGSADFHNASISGQVNGIQGKRSPGSTLKPFIYGLALDQGLIHSASVLRDTPSSFGSFSPENFDGRFTGPIAAQDALIRSRNVPAVDLAAKLSHPNLYDLLKLGGVQKLAPESHYGLALVLGGGELTPEELAQLYAVFPNQGYWQTLRYRQTPDAARASTPRANQAPMRLLSPAAAQITLEMLRQTPRPDTHAPARPAVAWKTGTSWGFRDAWTAGVLGRYVLVVWLGNFDGSSNPALVGIDAAAPLFFRIVDALRAERLLQNEVATVQPQDMLKIEVCAASGDLPNEACKVRSEAWYIAGKSPLRKSTLHRTVLVDQRTGQLACKPGPYTKEETFEYWSSEMAAIFKKAGMPLRAPPVGACDAADDPDGAPHIVLPLRGVIHILRIKGNQPLQLRANGSSGMLQHWFVGDALIGQAKAGEILSWLPPGPGQYALRVVDTQGRTDVRDINVEATE